MLIFGIRKTLSQPGTPGTPASHTTLTFPLELQNPVALGHQSDRTEPSTQVPGPSYYVTSGLLALASVSLASLATYSLRPLAIYLSLAHGLAVVEHDPIRVLAPGRAHVVVELGHGLADPDETILGAGAEPGMGGGLLDEKAEVFLQWKIRIRVIRVIRLI